jgi:hypothetical protein
MALALGALVLGAVAHDVVQRTLDAPAAEPIASHAHPRALAKLAVPAAPTATAPTAVPAAPTEPVAADEPFVPEFKWRRDRRELFLPLRGSLEGMRHFPMSSPPGIAINLPDAGGPSAGARVPVPHPGVSRIDLVPWNHGSRIRIWTDGIIDYRVEVVPGGLRVVLPADPSALQ